MTKNDPLEDKIILAVDDEKDILDIIEEELPSCILHRATDYESAAQYLSNYTYDAVILDVMGVNGFELLRNAVSRGFPAIMLTAHAVTPEALKRSIKLGAISFLPKDRIVDLREYLEGAIGHEGKFLWNRLFRQLEGYFNRRFGPDWKEKDKFFKEFQEALIKNGS